MSLPTSADPASDPVPDPSSVLSQRLDTLRHERADLVAATRVEGKGDAADQATDVEALIRLQVIDERIAALELEIAEIGRRPHVEGIVSIGDVVTLDLGAGDETYVVGSFEQAVAGVDTVTPGSPLGRAIVGAEVGSTVTYSPRRGVNVEVVIRAAGEPLPATA